MKTKDVFGPPEIKTPFNFLSLGAGVQSSTLAFMIAKGELEPVDCAIFSDTGAEPKSVYRWLEWLKRELPFPVHVVQYRQGLTAQEKVVKRSKNTLRHYRQSSVPFFVRNADGSRGVIRRKCTRDYKINPIKKKVRELAGIKSGQRELTVTQVIGISWDERSRMTAPEESWQQLRYPLIERRITRHMCKEWMLEHGYPEPPRSACKYCPYHSNKEWQRLKKNEPAEFAEAVAFEKEIKAISEEFDQVIAGELFLHSSLKPLGEINFETEQMEIDFGDECEGMCGL